jgi:hypothetical protein
MKNKISKRWDLTTKEGRVDARTKMVRNGMSKKVAIKKITPVVTTKLRDFYSLFPKVKNYNFHDVISKGNSLNEFIQIIENMPEENFSLLFSDAFSGEKYSINTKIKTNLSNSVLNYNIEKYSEEIKYLSKLYFINTHGIPVSKSITIEEFRKRAGISALSGIPVKSNSVLDGYESISKILFDTKKISQENYSYYLSDGYQDGYVSVPNYTFNTDGYRSHPTPDDQKIVISSLIASLKEAQPLRKNSDLSVNDSGSNPSLPKFIHRNYRPSLEELLEVRKEQNKKFAEEEKEDDDSLLSKELNKTLDFKNNNKHLFKDYVEQESLNNALKTITNYGNVVDGIKKTSAEALAAHPKGAMAVSLKCKKALVNISDAKDLFDKFDDLYAKKQVEVIDAERKMKAEKKNYLNTPVDHDYLTSLDVDTKNYLKAKRELIVLKKILKTSYEEFNKSSIQAADPDVLKQLERLSSTPTVSDYENLFSGVTKEVYDREMERRKSNRSIKSSGRKLS